MPLFPGTRLGTYEILSPLGAGGMGEVYRAKDSKLGRDVAIKVLPEAVAQDTERLARFEREARTLAALNHPNIVTIFAVEESGGTRFLAMELVEGESLDTLIASGGLPLSRFFDITVPLAEALSAAHERGIVHRDLKPGNVMITREGRVKVLDFGLAKLETADSDPNRTDMPTSSRVELTGEGQVFGTVAYMSPEQARGGKVDARSDVFSLGVVLYQLLTGERPFHGASAVDLISSILRDKPPSVTDLRADLPPHLGRILRRCLEKDPRDRYQTSRDVYNELKELRAETSLASPATSPRSEIGSARPPSGSIRADEGFWVAVLPVKYSGSNADLTALAEGLTEDIVTGLSRFSYLRVLGRSSTSRYANQSLDVRSAGEELGARYVMEGSLRQAGAKLRLAVQVVDTTSGAHLWAENYERAFSPDAVFEVQDDLVPRIVSTVADMNGILPRTMSEAVRSRPPGDLSPYEAVLRSFGYFGRVTPEELAAARSALELAVRKAPAYADALAMLALLCVQDYAQGFGLQADSLTKGLAAARRAVEAGSSNPLAYFSLTQALFFRKEIESFRHAAERTVALNPADGNSIAFVGELLTYAGDRERGLALAERAKQLNPHHPGWYWYANFYDAYRLGDDRGALGFALQVNLPGHWGAHLATAAACGQLGQREAAGKALRELLKLRPDVAVTLGKDIEKWWEPEYGERLVDGLRKAGLEIDGGPGTPTASATARPVSADSESGRVLRQDSGRTRAQAFWIAVLPFTHSGADPELESFAEGLAEDINAGLAKFPYLSVISRNSTLRFKAQASDVRAVGEQLGARYVLEGGIRKGASVLRINVQLVDAQTGAHLWAETYNRDPKDSDIFAVQDDITDRVVATVADSYGALVRSMAASVEEKPDAALTATDCVLRHFRYRHRITPEEHARVRNALEQFAEREPGHAAVWACLAQMYAHEFCLGYNRRPESLDRALRAARRSVDLDPTCQHGRNIIAQVHFFQRDVPAFRAAAEQVMAMNPRDTDTLGVMGLMLMYVGDFERGANLVRRAMDLNPQHADWFHWALMWEPFQKGDYEIALDRVRRMNMPGLFLQPLSIASCCGLLGRHAEAAAAVQELRALDKDCELQAREYVDCWLYASGLTERFLEGLRKAGLEIDGKEATAGALRMADSGAARAEEGFWVAVLPFKYGGDNRDLTALAAGLSEEIVTGLSRFSYLRVISRGSTSLYSSEAADVRSVGKELGARYVMDGSLRQAGTALRISVQLVDAVSGAHLWAETYTRSFRPEEIFELQDDVVPRIVSTIADWYGALPHSMSEALRSKSSDQLSPYEALLRSFGYYERGFEAHAAARAGLEGAVQQAPDNADCWAMLSFMYGEEHRFGFNAQPDPLGRSLQAARRAVDAAPSNHFAYAALAQALFFRKEFDAFRSAAERAIALNPMDGSTIEYMAHLIAFSGDWERGCDLAERGRELNPNYPGWYWAVPFHNAYRNGDYASARTFLLRSKNVPANVLLATMLAAVLGQLGEREASGKAVRELLVLNPDWARVGRTELGKWYRPDYVELLMDGLRKAGLDVAAEATEASPTGRDATISIAVLPFSDMSPAKDQEYLCEGMAEEIMNALVRIDGINVASRTSAFRARRQGEDLAAIARALSVGHVLEGSVRTAGNRIRVTAQLTDVATGFQLWSERYDRDVADVFAVQDEIAAGVVEAVKARLAPGERTVRARPQVGNLEAYRLYLKGRHLRYTKNDHAGALLCFEQAVALDPSHGPSWIGLADINVLAAAYGMKPSREAYAAAKTALETAAGLQGESAEALYVEGMIAFGERRWKDSERVLVRATEIEPSHVQARCWTAVLLCVQGRTEEAIQALERAREIDPLAPYPYAMTGMCLMVARRPEEADRFLDQALAFDEDNILALWVSGTARTARGLFDEAITRLERALAPSHSGAFIRGMIGWALAAAGRAEEARGVLEALRARPAPATTVLPEAWMLAALGDREGAWLVLDRAAEEKQLLVIFTGLPGFDPFRSDPRFPAFLERLGLPAAYARGSSS